MATLTSQHAKHGLTHYEDEEEHVSLMADCGSDTQGDQKAVPYSSYVSGADDMEDVAGDEPKGREQWSRKIEFILACVGYAVGLGNVWRFPYLCYKSGGGAFLIPYFIMLFLCGIPLLYMELAVGQYTRQGPIGALKKICPFFKGAGAATVVVSYLLATYYNVIITWAAYYLVHSFSAELPWASCNNTWNTDKCWANYGTNATKPNDTVSASEEYYNYNVLDISPGIEHIGKIKWELALLLLVAWIAVYFCIFKGVRSSGKVVYFTATFPYLVLFILLVRGVTLPGAWKGIYYFLKPRWELLLEPEVWVNAASQNFNSIGIAFGSLIAMSSYNKFSNNIFRDVMSVALLNSATSILAGFVIFSILGYIATNQGKEVDDVVTQGPGLVFVTYPEAFNTLDVPQVWAVLFFTMLLMLGLDSQFCMVEVLVTTLWDLYEKQIKKVLRRREFLVLVVCIVSFFLGLPHITQGGIYVFTLLDSYSSGISLMYLAFFEVIAITWVYGGVRLSRNVEEMTGRRPYKFFTACWLVISPALIFAIWMFGWVQYKPVKYGKHYVYPDWAQGLGWIFASLSIVCIPIGAVHAVYEAKGLTLLEKFRTSLKSTLPEDGYGPGGPSVYEDVTSTRQRRHTNKKLADEFAKCTTKL